MAEPISFVRACKDFFEPGSRKLEIAEFRALTPEDKAEIRELLIAEGYDIVPIQVLQS